MLTAEPSAISAEGLSLIQEFEGLRLSSYRCASGVLTIGWGHTGDDVTEAMTITRQRALELLRNDLKRFELAVIDLIQVPLTQAEFDAICSFAFNCGIGALQSSTFCRRINAGDDKRLCFEQEFIKWTRGSTGVLPGLVRRRKAEIHLATT